MAKAYRASVDQLTDQIVPTCVATAHGYLHSWFDLMSKSML